MRRESGELRRNSKRKMTKKKVVEGRLPLKNISIREIKTHQNIVGKEERKEKVRVLETGVREPATWHALPFSCNHDPQGFSAPSSATRLLVKA